MAMITVVAPIIMEVSPVFIPTTMIVFAVVVIVWSMRVFGCGVILCFTDRQPNLPIIAHG